MTSTEHAQFVHQQLTSLRDHAQRDVDALAAAVVEQQDWQWQLDKLMRRRTTVRLYTLAVDRDVDTAAREAVTLVLNAATDTGSTNLYDRAMRESRAYAARDVLSGLRAAGLTQERVGVLMLGER